MSTPLLLFPTCNFDLGGSGLPGAGEVPRAARVPAGVHLLDPGDHQVALPHNLELVRRGQVQELAVLDPPGDIIGKRRSGPLAHLTTGFGCPSGGEHPRMTLSPIVAVVATGLIRKSLWMSATLKVMLARNKKRLMVKLRKWKRPRFKS